MRLCDGAIDKEYIVRDIELDDERLQIRLRMLGMTLGAQITILNKKRSGSTVIKIRGTRFAIGAAIAKGVLV